MLMFKVEKDNVYIGTPVDIDGVPINGKPLVLPEGLYEVSKLITRLAQEGPQLDGNGVKAPIAFYGVILVNDYYYKILLTTVYIAIIPTVEIGP